MAKKSDHQAVRLSTTWQAHVVDSTTEKNCPGHLAHCNGEASNLPGVALVPGLLLIWALAVVRHTLYMRVTRRE